MGWQDDLQALLGNVVGSAQSGVQQSVANFAPPPTPNSPWQSALNAMTNPNNPVHGVMDTLNPNIGVNLGDPLHVPGDIIGSALRTLEVPANVVQTGIGLGTQGLTSALMGLGIGDRAGQQHVLDAYAQGGGKGVWNYLVSKQPIWAQAIFTLGTDPMNYIGAGLGPDVAKALAEGAAEAANPLSRLGLQAAGKGVEGLQAFNDAPGRYIADPARSMITGVGSKLRTPGDYAELSIANPKLLDLSPQSKNAIFREKYHGLLTAWDAGMSRLEQMYPNLKDHYAAIRAGQPTPQPIMGAAEIAPVPEHLDEHLAREFGNPELHPAGVNVLLKPSITNPEIPMGNMLKTHLNEAKTDFANVRTAMTDPFTGRQAWTRETSFDERVNIARRYDHGNGLVGDQSVETIIKKWQKDGVDPLLGEPVDAAVNREAAKNGALLGIKSQKGNLYELAKGAWGESALASGSFHTTNFLNGVLQNAIQGIYKVPGARDIIRAYNLARGGIADPTDVGAVRYQMASEQTANIYGRSLPTETTARGLGQNLSRSRTTVSPGAELIRKVPLPGAKTIAKGYGRIMLFNRQIGQGIETNLRSIPWAETLDQHMMQNLPMLDDQIRQTLGNDIADRVSLVQMRTPVNGEPPLLAITPEGVRQKLIDAGANTGQAERVARDVAHEINIGHQDGLAAMKKAQFSYEKTNADQFFSNVAPFLYWQSRAFPKYTEEALRHPFLALAYFREMQATDDANKNPGMDARAKGFLNFMGTYAGFTALLNPQALWGIAQIYDSNQDFTPEGMTPVGQALNFLQTHGVGAYPWIQATLNLTGMMGDTFEPDFFGIRQKAIIAAGLQYATAKAGLPPPGAPMSAATGALRADVSSFLSELGAPDWLLKPVYQKGGQSQAEASLDKLIENRIISNHTVDPTTGQTDLNNQQLLAIITNPNDPEYHRAYQDVANAGLIQQVNNFVSPVKLKLRDAQTDVRQAVQNNIYDLAKQKGVRPQDIKPTIADVEFAAGFKLTTGRDWQPSDYTETKLQQDLTNAVPGAKQFILDQHDYSQLQTPAYNEYLSLAGGENPKTKNLTPDAQQQYALEWADRNGKMPEINQVFTLQKVFRATHPEFDVFKQWESGMRSLASQYPGGTLAMYRQEASRLNPDAAAYFAKVDQKARQYYPNDPTAQQQYIEQQTISADAWFAITGQAKLRGDNIPVPLGPNQAPQDVTLTNMTPTQPTIPTPQWLAQLGVNWQNE